VHTTKRESGFEDAPLEFENDPAPHGVQKEDEEAPGYKDTAEDRSEILTGGDACSEGWSAPPEREGRILVLSNRTRERQR
jgi:hypothetical protein